MAPDKPVLLVIFHVVVFASTIVTTALLATRMLRRHDARVNRAAVCDLLSAARALPTAASELVDDLGAEDPAPPIASGLPGARAPG